MAISTTEKWPVRMRDHPGRNIQISTMFQKHDSKPEDQARQRRPLGEFASAKSKQNREPERKRLDHMAQYPMTDRTHHIERRQDGQTAQSNVLRPG